MKVRVINKNKEGVTVKVLGMPKGYGQPRMEMKWDEFNRDFEQIDGFMYKTTDAYDKVINEKVDFFQSMLPTMFRMRAGNSGDSLLGYSMLVTYQEKYIEKFGGTIADFLQEYKFYEKQMIESMMDSGVGVGRVHTRGHKFKHEKWSDEKRERINKSQTREKSFDTETFTLGDMIKEKQKKC